MSVELPLYPEYEKKEKCGLFGIWGSPDAARICYQGLFAQQHRGQESAGIVVSDGTNLNGHTGMGLGFFIAKTLLERSGATVTVGNGKGAGAVVSARWPRAAIEAPPMPDFAVLGA